MVANVESSVRCCKNSCSGRGYKAFPEEFCLPAADGELDELPKSGLPCPAYSALRPPARSVDELHCACVQGYSGPGYTFVDAWRAASWTGECSQSALPAYSILVPASHGDPAAGMAVQCKP